MLNEGQWEDRFKSFIKRAGDEIKRAGDEIRTEAERLISEVKDPEKQQRVRAGLKDFGTWARKTAEEVAERVEGGVKKAEVALRKASDRWTPGMPANDDHSDEVTPVDPRAPHSGDEKTPTSGRKSQPRASAAKKSRAKSPAVKKTLGKKPKAKSKKS